MDTKYSPGFLQLPLIPFGEIPLPAGYFTDDEATIQGPEKDKLMRLWDELTRPVIEPDTKI